VRRRRSAVSLSVQVCRDLFHAHPRLSIDLVLTDRLVDLIEEVIDVVVRIGPPKDSQLFMRKLIDDYRVVVGAHISKPAARPRHRQNWRLMTVCTTVA
jgi:DNA-binding transcriptional LysR family regulator